MGIFVIKFQPDGFFFTCSNNRRSARTSRSFIQGESIMQTVLLTIHTLIALALVALVLLQRSEGGGLGIGGGGTGGGFMTARGTANLLTKATAILATCFFITSIGLAIMAGAGTKQTSIVDEVLNAAPATTSEPAQPTVPTGQ